MKTTAFLLSLVIAVGSFTAFVRAQDDMADARVTTAQVNTHPSQGGVTPIEGGRGWLYTTDQGVAWAVHTTGLEPNHVYTAWFVVVNDPENCAASPCAPDDILAGTDNVQSEIAYGDGIITGEDGMGHFAGYVPVGPLEGGWMGHDFSDPQGAEIHIVLNDHGPVIPDAVANMINSYRGGCTDESLPPPFPDTAKADGEPGPNTCELVQAAIFQH